MMAALSIPTCADLAKGVGSFSGGGLVVEGGWIQVNSTLVPCIYRDKQRHLPLSVLQFSAGILTDRKKQRQVAAKQTTAAERMRLNELCAEAGLQFPKFPKSTRVISIGDFYSMCGHQLLFVKELPLANVWDHVDFKWQRDKRRKCNRKTSRLKPAVANATKKKSSCSSANPSADDATKKKAVRAAAATETVGKKRDATGVPKRQTQHQDVTLPLPARNQTQTWITSSATQKRNVNNYSLPSTSPGNDCKLSLVRFYGKSIPCVVHDYEVYTSVDTLRKTYFNQCHSPEEFQDVFQRVVKVPLVTLGKVVNLVMEPEGRLSTGQTLYVKLKEVASYWEQLQSLLRSPSPTDVRAQNSAPSPSGTQSSLAVEAPLDLTSKVGHGLAARDTLHVVSNGVHDCSLGVGFSQKDTMPVPTIPVPVGLQTQAHSLPNASHSEPNPNTNTRPALGETVKKRRRLENTIFKIVKGKCE